MLICLSGLPEAYCPGASLGIVATARQRPLGHTAEQEVHAICLSWEQWMLYSFLLFYSLLFSSQLVPPPNAVTTQ